ncbi:hypothetical protein [Bifidobacterium mongoliense]|uniref:hypothetical protein n=1 Tax=Bifidobacterium mongoliense TaxID=518643 RepID=UPI0030EE731E
MVEPTPTADTAGNDLSKVNIPIGGALAFAPYDKANVIADADLGATPLKLPAAYKTLGLMKKDGAPQTSIDQEDSTEFWQKGYEKPGDATRTVEVTAAEDNPAVLQLTEGKTPNVDGIIYVDSSLPAARIMLSELVKYRDGGVERRRNGVAQVTKVEPGQDSRGENPGVKITLKWQEDPLFNGSPYKQFGPAVPKGAPKV